MKNKPQPSQGLLLAMQAYQNFHPRKATVNRERLEAAVKAYEDWMRIEGWTPPLFESPVAYKSARAGLLATRDDLVRQRDERSVSELNDAIYRERKQWKDPCDEVQSRIVAERVRFEKTAGARGMDLERSLPGSRYDYVRSETSDSWEMWWERSKLDVAVTVSKPTDDRVCQICDGGPGNSGACGCGLYAYEVSRRQMEAKEATLQRELHETVVSTEAKLDQILEKVSGVFGAIGDPASAVADLQRYRKLSKLFDGTKSSASERILLDLKLIQPGEENHHSLSYYLDRHETSGEKKRED